MAPIPGISGGMVGAANQPPVLSFLESRTTSANTTSQSFSGVSLGAAAPDRKIILAISHYITISAAPSSVTIGGISATKLVDNTSTASLGVSSIWIAAVPTGTSATVIINSTGDTTDYIGMGVYRVTGLRSMTPVDTFSSSTRNTSDTPTILQGGFVVAQAHSSASNDAITGLSSSDYNVTPEATYNVVGASQSNLLSAPTVSFSNTSGSWTSRVLVSMR